jgi:hypothetical protein
MVLLVDGEQKRIPMSLQARSLKVGNSGNYLADIMVLQLKMWINT